MAAPAPRTRTPSHARHSFAPKRNYLRTCRRPTQCTLTCILCSATKTKRTSRKIRPRPPSTATANRDCGDLTRPPPYSSHGHRTDPRVHAYSASHPWLPYQLTSATTVAPPPIPKLSRRTTCTCQILLLHMHLLFHHHQHRLFNRKSFRKHKVALYFPFTNHSRLIIFSLSVYVC